MQTATRSRRVRIERGIYVQPNGKYAVCCRRAGKLRFRTVEGDLAKARLERTALIEAAELGVEPVSPRLRFGTVAGWWLDRFEARVLVGERHPRTLEAHRYQLEHNLLPVLGTRRIATLTVDDVAGVLLWLRRRSCAPKTSAAALATLHSVLHYARRHSWITVDPVAQLIWTALCQVGVFDRVRGGGRVRVLVGGPGRRARCRRCQSDDARIGYLRARFRAAGLRCLGASVPSVDGAHS
jgi:hypothetical protein